MAEQVFYEDGDVKVTNARFIVASQTYAMNGVTSVKSHTVPENRGAGILGLIIGVIIFAASSGGTRVVGLIVAAAGAYLIYAAKAEHAVVLNSSSGEAQALTSKDEAYIRNVINALNDALIHRG